MTPPDSLTAVAYAILREYGFPALVAIFVLVRLEGRLEKLTEAVWRLVAVHSLHGRPYDHGDPHPKNRF